MRRSHLTVLIAIAILAFLAHWPNLRQPINRDISAYATIGARMLHGDWPYRDLFDHKQPLIYGIMAALQWIAPRSNVAIQLAATFIAALGGIALFMLLTPLAGSGASAAAALLFVSLGAARVFEGTDLNTEHVLASLACLAVLLPLSLRRPVSTRAAALIGLLGALATMTKAVAVFLLPALLVAMLWEKAPTFKRVAGQITAFSLGLVLPWLALVVVYWCGGAVGALFDANIGYNLKYVSWLQRQMVLFGTPLNWLLLVGAGVLAIRLSVRKGQDRLAWVILLWLAGAAVGAKIGRGDFPHYFAPMLPPAIVAACLPFGVARDGHRRGLSLIRAGGLIAICAPFLYDIAAGYRLKPAQVGFRMFGDQSITWNYQKPVGAWLRNRANADDTLFVAGAEPGFYWQSSLRPAVRYLYDYPARLIPAKKEELITGLKTNPPRFVVLSEPGNDANFDEIRDQYDLATTIGPVRVFEIRPDRR